MDIQLGKINRAFRSVTLSSSVPVLEPRLGRFGLRRDIEFA